MPGLLLFARFEATSARRFDTTSQSASLSNTAGTGSTLAGEVGADAPTAANRCCPAAEDLSVEWVGGMIRAEAGSSDAPKRGMLLSLGGVSSLLMRTLPQ